MKLYHGTNNKFETVDFSKAGSVTEDMSCTGGLGFWMTENLEYARCYARNAAFNGGEAVVLVVEVDDSNFDNTWEPTSLEAFVAEVGANEARRTMMDDEGHNGLINYTDFGTEYCAFDNDSIISISTLE